MTRNKFWRMLIGLNFVLLALLLAFSVSKIVDAWVNPIQTPPGGSGVIVVSDGNVGIGTVNPEAKLDIVGSMKITTKYTDLPSGSWSDIDSYSEYSGAFYSVVVQKATDAPNFTTYFMLFSAGYYGTSVSILGSATALSGGITASFRGMRNFYGPYKLQVNPSNVANVYVTRIQTF